MCRYRQWSRTESGDMRFRCRKGNFLIEVGLAFLFVLIPLLASWRPIVKAHDEGLEKILDRRRSYGGL